MARAIVANLGKDLMLAFQRKSDPMSASASARIDKSSAPIWFGASADKSRVLSFGIRIEGGGAHLSKTMMLQELEALMETGYTTAVDLKKSAVDENAIGKPTGNTRRLTFKHMAFLYGLNEQPPLTVAFLKLWRSDPEGHRLQALLVALARDPLLRTTASVVMSGVTGQNLRSPIFKDALLEAYPGRFSDTMVSSLARNCASSWTQSGHLQGPNKKVRQRVSPTPSAVALAALLATASGFGGPAMLSSGWMKILDLSAHQALDQLRRAEAIGLARVRSAGDVTEISVRHPMSATLGVRALAHI
jgi:hypothetical protein